jgi:hypothetical protein
MEVMAEETKMSARDTMMDGFFLQAHTDLILCLTGGNMQSVMSPRLRPVVNLMYEMNCKYVL